MDNLKQESLCQGKDSVYTIRQATADELACIANVEKAAAQQFAQIGFHDFDNDTVPIERLKSAQQDGHVWAVVSEEKTVVGFALVSVAGEKLHLEEVDIHPDHARQGLGRAMITVICDWARTRGVKRVSLSTFKDVVWNAPYYARLGFEIVPKNEWTEEFARIIQAEGDAGLDVERRVIMVKSLQK